MGNYIRRVRVTELFDQDTELVVDFDQSVNCIYGANGTGKTVLINLIVNAFKVNISDLLRAPFASITILTSADGKNKPENFVTVNKQGDEITYTFFKNQTHISYTRFDHENPITYEFLEGISYTPSSAIRRHKSRNALFDLDDEIKTINIGVLKQILMNQVSLTYVPLLRHSDSYDYRPTLRHGMPDDEFTDFIDPNVRVLKGLQEEFSKRYASAQSAIARRLESLSSIIFEKLLFSDDALEEESRATSLLQKLMSNKVVDEDESKVESVISQIHDLHLDITENKIRNHYNSWHAVQRNLIDTYQAQLAMDENTSNEERNDLITKYSKAYYNLIALTNVHNKLEEAIEEIRKVHLSKQLVLGPFNLFKSEINRFLSGNKTFNFDDSGEFEFSNNGRILEISKLSSGEKHLIAILGRVTFSSFSGTSTFIADEPELSLHLEWQREILPAIRRLSPNTQVIVATHAPAIIALDSNTIDIENCYKYV